MKIPVQNRSRIFSAGWVVSSIYLALQVWQGYNSDNLLMQIPSMIILFVMTILLLWWLNSTQSWEGLVMPSRVKGGFIYIAMLVAVLIALPIVMGAHLLWLLPVAGLTALFVIKKPVPAQESAYVFALAVITTVAATSAGWISTFSPTIWAFLQFLLVITGCLAGWQIIRQSILHQRGIGQSQFLNNGWAAGIKSFVTGIIMALPWALGIIVLGGAKSETWVEFWWHPLVAIQPAIGEEAWARILLVPLLYLLTSRFYRPRVAFTLAVVVIAYWFAFLHTVGSSGVIINTLFTGTLYALPISYVCLYKDFESAVGFHFCVDFLKFLYAFLVFSK